MVGEPGRVVPYCCRSIDRSRHLRVLQHAFRFEHENEAQLDMPPSREFGSLM
jgi:hypothetical protein